MTKPMMDLRALVERAATRTCCARCSAFAAERLMDLEVGARTNAEYGEKSVEQLAQRNGYRERDWETRAGSVELRIPACAPGPVSRLFLSHGDAPKSLWRP